MKINMFVPLKEDLTNMGRIKLAATQTKSAHADYRTIDCFKFCLSTRSFLTLVLTCSLFLCFSVNFISSAVAAPSQIAENVDANSQSDRVPPKVVKAVIADLSQQQNLPPEKLKVTKYSRESWSDGCLGLAQPEEICSQAIVEGWRVVVSDGSQKWIYRTDNSGRNVRLEAPQSKVKS